MSLNKFALILAAAFSTVYAIDPTQSAELNAILNDAKGNLPQYMSIANQVTVPPEILQVGMAIATATDDSYTTYYSQIDFDQVSSLMTALPWYSSRLEPAISSALATLETSESSSATEVPTATSSSEAPSSEAPSSETTSSEATSSEASPSEDASSTITSSPTETTEASSTAAISQLSDGQINAQSENGAAKAVVGLGAGAVAAAALLL